MESAECRLCPRRCGADRTAGKRGFCGADSGVRVAYADLHLWEEPPLTGTKGAGAVFFSGCPLQCVYCQNYAISRTVCGQSVTSGRLAETFLLLEERGAAVLDLVTGTPYTPQIIRAVKRARSLGLRLPVVWNTSGYETVETLKTLEGIVDIYLPDFKYWRNEDARRYSGAPDYRRTAKLALQEMVRQQPGCRLGKDGIMQCGVLVRHLLLPGRRREAEHLLSWLSEMYTKQIWVSLMRQFTPVPGLAAYPELQTGVENAQYDKAARYAEKLGFETLFLQEEGCADAAYIPDFTGSSG